MKTFFNFLRINDFNTDLFDFKYLPRWVILLIDLTIVFISIIASFYIANIFRKTDTFIDDFYGVGYIFSVTLLFMLIFRTYSGIIRHSTFVDLIRLVLAISCSIFSIGIVNYFLSSFIDNDFIHSSFGFLIVYGTMTTTLLFIFRLVVKEFFHILSENKRSNLKRNILVLGVNGPSVSVATAIQGNSNLPYQVIGFIATERFSSAKLLGQKIYTERDIVTYTKDKFNADSVLIVEDNFSDESIDHWMNLFLEKGFQILKSPSLQKIRKKDLASSIENVQIEDLLHRKPIKIDNLEVNKNHYKKSILVTGGAGSIGSEIVRQVAQHNPEVLVILDQAETPLYELGIQVKQLFPDVSIKIVMMDVCNKERLEQLFRKYSFSIVYHAAAYKHVPLVEEHPEEGVRVNVEGTHNVASLSLKYNVERFVMISTDKAVNPTNVMGATKRVAELLVQSYQNSNNNKTKFITTRFGNVLGSNGSVIPHFKKQIAKGGPVTVTHPEIYRYFMTIPEACELVLEACCLGNGGEVFVFDMGEPIKIVDLAKRMIKLSGYRPNIDIKIEYVGLRPGEKLFEELITDEAIILPTMHDKIMISKDCPKDYNKILFLVNEIIQKTYSSDKLNIVQDLKNIVPEFKSKNSIYQKLDE